MRKKTINICKYLRYFLLPDEYTTVGKNPGPGTYKSVHNLATNGNYFVSKYKNACCRIIAPGASRRFKGKIKGKPQYRLLTFQATATPAPARTPRNPWSSEARETTSSLS